MSSNTNIGNTPVNQGYVQLIHTGETGGIDGTLRTLYDGDGTASDLQIASNKVKVSTELYIGSKTATEFIQDIVGDMFTTGSYTNITTTYDDTNGNIDLSASGEVTLTGIQTLTNKTLASPTFTGTANGDNLTLTGDLTVSGDTIFTNSNTVLIGDAILTLNADETGSPTANAGFEVERGTSTNKSFLWNETTDKWTIGSETFVAGTVEANLTGNVTGSASLNLLISNNLSDLASAATARTNLGVSIGSDVQAYDVGLQSISGLTTAADKMIYTTASDTYAVTSLTSTARTLLDDTSIGAMRTTLGLGLLATRDTVDFDRIDGTAYITSAEAFSDSDLQLMTAAAIDDLIVSKGYGTGNGDITAVNAGVGIGGGATSGDVDLTFEGSELPDMTDLMGPTDEFVVLDGTTSKRKAISEIRLTAFDDTGFSSGISFNGSTANGLLTYGSSTTADVESALTFDGTDLAIAATGKIYLDGGSNTYIDEVASGQLRLVAGGTEVLKGYSGGAIDMYGSNIDRAIQIGANRTGNANSYIDFIGDTTYTDYGLRIIRWGYQGVNAQSAIYHRGTGDMLYVNQESAPHIWYIGGGEKMRIDSSGNLGIGVTSPSFKLSVAGGDIQTDGYIRADDGVITHSSVDGSVVTLSNNGTYTMLNNPQGNVGLYIGDTGDGQNYYQSGAHRFRSYDGSTYFGTLNSTGLKLGTGFASYKLDVAGDAKISSGSLGVGVNPNATDGRGDFSNDVVAFSTSDKRLKENIKPLDSALDKVLKISGVEFDWKELTEEEKKTIHGNEGHDVGVIAQEIEEVLPEVVTTRDSGYKAVKYEKIVPLLIQAIKELKTEIEELKNG